MVGSELRSRDCQRTVPRDHDLCYLGIYVYDNTTCFLRWLKVELDRSSGLSSN